MAASLKNKEIISSSSCSSEFSSFANDLRGSKSSSLESIPFEYFTTLDDIIEALANYALDSLLDSRDISNSNSNCNSRYSEDCSSGNENGNGSNSKDTLSDAYIQAATIGDLLRQFEKGMDVDIRFDSVDSFEKTLQTSIFDFFGIRLLHAWIPASDAATKVDMADLLQGLSYNQLLNEIACYRESKGNNVKISNSSNNSSSGINNNNNKDISGSELSTSSQEFAAALTAPLIGDSSSSTTITCTTKAERCDLLEKFLKNASMQCTVEGIASLHSYLASSSGFDRTSPFSSSSSSSSSPHVSCWLGDAKLFILFKNNHFSTCLYMRNTIYCLITDAEFCFSSPNPSPNPNSSYKDRDNESSMSCAGDGGGGFQSHSLSLQGLHQVASHNHSHLNTQNNNFSNSFNGGFGGFGGLNNSNGSRINMSLSLAWETFDNCCGDSVFSVDLFNEVHLFYHTDYCPSRFGWGDTSTSMQSSGPGYGNGNGNGHVYGYGSSIDCVQGVDNKQPALPSGPNSSLWEKGRKQGLTVRQPAAEEVNFSSISSIIFPSEIGAHAPGYLSFNKRCGVIDTDVRYKNNYNHEWLTRESKFGSSNNNSKNISSCHQQLSNSAADQSILSNSNPNTISHFGCTNSSSSSSSGLNNSLGPAFSRGTYPSSQKLPREYGQGHGQGSDDDDDYDNKERCNSDGECDDEGIDGKGGISAGELSSFEDEEEEEEEEDGRCSSILYQNDSPNPIFDHNLGDCSSPLEEGSINAYDNKWESLSPKPCREKRGIPASNTDKDAVGQMTDLSVGRCQDYNPSLVTCRNPSSNLHASSPNDEVLLRLFDSDELIARLLAQECEEDDDEWLK